MSKTDKIRKKTSAELGNKLLKIGRGGALISILLYILAMVAVVFMFIAAIEMYATFAVNEKFNSRIDQFRLLMDVYRSKSDEPDRFDSFDEMGVVYYVVDKDGSVIHINGEDSRVKDEGSDLYDFVFVKGSGHDAAVYENHVKDNDDYDLESSKLDLRFYQDVRTKNYIRIDEETFIVDFKKILKDDTIEDQFKDEGEISVPFWFSYEVGNGETFFMKTAISAKTSDIVFLLAVALILAFILFVILIAVLVRIISNIRKNKKMTKLLFMDNISLDHNWLWFLIKGQEELRRRRNASTQYAVVNMVFVNYRNYVLCHSLEDGHKFLCRIYDELSFSCVKGELCAHSTSSNFPMLLKVKDKDSLKKRLESMIKKLEKIDSDHGFGFHAGVCLIQDNKGCDLDTEYNNASSARMKLEGTDGSGIAFFDADLVEEQKWIDSVQESQQAAIDNEEFVVYYQPKYDPRTNSLRGAEALIRWDSPKYGFVSPGRIIPIFEKNGFITEIDHYMLRKVAQDQKAWLDQGFKCVPVSVNVSRAHFSETDLAEQIRDIIDKERCPHDLIEIELTESAFFDDQKAMVTTISNLQKYGFKVSMDDFGSGYSSLNSLKDLPLDVLKLDAGFFRGNNSEDGRDRIVVSEALKLARLLNMKTVAEGVEEKDQVDFLATEGCDMIQGYYFAKPMPGEEYKAKMEIENRIIARVSDNDDEAVTAGPAEDPSVVVSGDASDDQVSDDGGSMPGASV